MVVLGAERPADVLHHRGRLAHVAFEQRYRLGLRVDQGDLCQLPAETIQSHTQRIVCDPLLEDHGPSTRQSILLGERLANLFLRNPTATLAVLAGR